MRRYPDEVEALFIDDELIDSMPDEDRRFIRAELEEEFNGAPLHSIPARMAIYNLGCKAEVKIPCPKCQTTKRIQQFPWTLLSCRRCETGNSRRMRQWMEKWLIAAIAGAQWECRKCGESKPVTAFPCNISTYVCSVCQYADK